MINVNVISDHGVYACRCRGVRLRNLFHVLKLAAPISVRFTAKEENENAECH